MALPGMDRSEVDLSVEVFGKKLKAPIVISGMTGGYEEAAEINENLAKAAAEVGVGFGVGSQRAAFEEPGLAYTYEVVKKHKVPLVFGNIGVPQLKDSGVDYARKAMEMVGADLLAIHLNYLHEIIQPEGETYAGHAIGAIKKIATQLPVIAKETGAGISRSVAQQLIDAGVKGIDVGGLGGTSFSAVEVYRARLVGNDEKERLGQTFWNWGIPTPISVLESKGMVPIIATGGVRNGLDAARAIALGADLAGMARPLLKPAMDGYNAVVKELKVIISEIRAAMFLTGARNIGELAKRKYIITGRTAHWMAQLGYEASPGGLKIGSGD
jgi:isopentenyl-diphosphate delta-isomerase